MTPKLRDIIYYRSGMYCERCGVGVRNNFYSIHHRQPRGMGGSKHVDYPENLVLLCGSGTSGCHGWVESNRETAIAQGWLVPRRSGLSPEETPIYVHGSWYWVRESRLEPVDLEPPF